MRWGLGVRCLKKNHFFGYAHCVCICFLYLPVGCIKSAQGAGDVFFRGRLNRNNICSSDVSDVSTPLSYKNRGLTPKHPNQCTGTCVRTFNHGLKRWKTNKKMALSCLSTKSVDRSRQYLSQVYVLGCDRSDILTVDPDLDQYSCTSLLHYCSLGRVQRSLSSSRTLF